MLMPPNMSCMIRAFILSKYIMNKSLSDRDIWKALSNRTNLIVYPELRNYSTINEIFGPYDTAVLLYLDSKNMGHWTGLIKRNNRIEFFDPYSNKPDTEFGWYDKKVRHKYNYKGVPYL